MISKWIPENEKIQLFNLIWAGRSNYVTDLGKKQVFFGV